MNHPSAAPWFYRALLTAIVPFALIRLWWRGRKQPGYRQHISERFGFLKIPPGGPVIWLHAVSVGETRAAEPLVDSLLVQYPTHRILLTHMTPTGRETSLALYKNPRVLIAYVPYDLMSSVDRFLKLARPEFGLLMETEIWPNLILRSRKHRIPIFLINARLSARSAQRYKRFHSLISPVLSALTAVGAQTPEDAERLTSLGASSVHVTGNLKFDVRIDPKLQSLGQLWRSNIQETEPKRLIWLAASTREGEEPIILAAHRELCAKLAPARPLLILVPRHPQRFDDVASLIIEQGFNLIRRSQKLPLSNTDVWLGDSMGEMVAYYSTVDLVVMGGTLLPFGGQNLIEAAACKTPVILGPHIYNFGAAAKAAKKCGAAIQLQEPTAANISDAIADLLNNSEQYHHAVNATKQFIAEATGATEKTCTLLSQFISPGVIHKV